MTFQESFPRELPPDKDGKITQKVRIRIITSKYYFETHQFSTSGRFRNSLLFDTVIKL